MAESLSGLRRNRIHRALSRPNLLMGADRELVLLTGLAAVILIFVVLTVYSALFGVAVWIVIVGLLRMMAKSDPLMRKVYMRYLASIAIERSGNSDLLKALAKDYRPGLWGHRTLKPANGAPLRELELAGSVAPLLATYAQLSLLQASDDLASFTNGTVWADLSRNVAAGEISARSQEWRWSGFG
jgi:type IV secretory pathway TrbD component